MNKKDDQKLKIILNLLPILILIAMVLGCGGTNQSVANKPDPSPANTPTEEKKPEKETAEKSPVEPFYGNWETKDPTTGQFERWKFGTAEKEGSEYVGRITNLDTNVNLGKYRVGTSDKSVTLELSAGQGSLTYDYEIAPDGSKITLKGNNPIVLTRGTSNADIIKDAEIIADLNKSNWKLSDGREVFFVFDKSTAQYDSGYAGMLQFVNPNGTKETKQFTITSKNKIVIKDDMGQRAASYDLQNNGDDMIITFDKSGEKLYFSRR